MSNFSAQERETLLTGLHVEVSVNMPGLLYPKMLSYFAGLLILHSPFGEAQGIWFNAILQCGGRAVHSDLTP